MYYTNNNEITKKCLHYKSNNRISSNICKHSLRVGSETMDIMLCMHKTVLSNIFPKFALFMPLNSIKCTNDFKKFLPCLIYFY